MRAGVIRYYLTIMLVAFTPGLVLAQDVQLTIPQASLQSVLDAMIYSKYLNYGATIEVGDGFLGYKYNMDLTGATLTLQPNSSSIRFFFSCSAKFETVVWDFKYYSGEKHLDLYCHFSLDHVGNGYKITFVPERIVFDDGNSLLEQWVQDNLNGFLAQLPEISTTSEQPILTSIVSQYYTSGTPSLTVNTGRIDLNFYLKVGTPVIAAFNYVNNQVGIGNIQDEEGVNNWVTNSSPSIFRSWSQGQIHNVQTPSDLIAASNGQNKYRYWLDEADPSLTPLPEIASRRISILVGSSDATYKARFDQAQHVQLANNLEGALAGGTVTYKGQGSSPSYDAYDYKFESGPVTSVVPSGTFGRSWNFLGWSDGYNIQQRTITLANDVNLTASYKSVHSSGDPNGFIDNSQRKIIQTADFVLHQVYTSMGHVWYETSTNQGSSWTLMNNGQPLDVGGGKCPSIDYTGNSGGYAVAIVFQQQGTNGYTYTLQLDEFVKANGIWQHQIGGVPYTMYYESNDPYSVDANPSMAWGLSGVTPDLVVAFERKTNANGRSAGINCIAIQLLQGPVMPPYTGAILNPTVGPYVVPGSTQNFVRPSVHANKAAGITQFELVYEERSIGDWVSRIYQTILSYYLTFQTPPTPWLISSSSFPGNYNPSIVQLSNAVVRV